MTEQDDRAIWSGLRRHLDLLDVGRAAVVQTRAINMPRSRSLGGLSWVSLAALLAVLGVGLWVGRPSQAVVDRAESKSLVLEIRADRSSYVPGEPITVTASLTYKGPASTIQIVHGAPLVGFGVREPVFSERLSPSYSAIRDVTTLRRSVPLVVAFAKTASSLDAFDPDFAAYARDPVFWLPEGVWTIYAAGQFQVAPGETESLTATISIRVANPGP